MAPIDILLTDMKNSSYDRYLLKRIIFLNLGTLLVVLATYLCMLFFLSHINSFWEIFKGKDKYEVKDTIPPVSPYIDPIPQAIKEDKLDVTGKSEPNSRVLLYIDKTKQSEVIADADGNYTFLDIQVGFSPLTLSTVAIDQAGNTSSESRSYSIYRDNEPPEIEIISPKKNEVFRATERTYTVKGKTDPGNSVYINDQLALVDNEGEFYLQINLRDGGNELKFKAVDKAENELEQKIFMSFEKIE